MLRQIRARKVDDTIMRLAIISQPHKSPDDAQEFVETLIDQQRFYRGDDKVAEQLDLVAFEAWRSATQEQSRLIRAK